MASKNEETIRAFWGACERRDYEAAGRLIGDGYTWIDHTTDVVATTPEELQAALEEDLAWSDQKFEIESTHEVGDTVVVRAVVTQTLTGTWRSIQGHGQQVRREICDIFRFDADGRIVVEELYEDALSLTRQLGPVSV
jgi:ketosteroid isomerase-like protein